MKKRLCAIQFAEVAEMKKAFLCVLIIVVLISGLAACAQPDDVLPEDVTIQTDRDVYIPIMSSAVGIGLTPVYTLERPLWQSSGRTRC